MDNSIFFSIKIGDIGKISMCKRILKHQTSENEKIPFYKISTFGGKASTFISNKLYLDYKNRYSYPKKGDILISASGTIGKTVIFNNEDAYFQDSNIVWVDNNEKIIRNDFLYYFYQTNPWTSTNGSTIKRLYNDDLKNIVINYPYLQTQQKIANILSTLDAKIELNNRINEELEAMAKTLYDYWFVQFDFPNSKGQPYKSSGGKMVYSEELKREIPEGWGVKQLGDIVQIKRGISYTSKDLQAVGTPMINLNSFYLDGTNKPSGIKYYSGKYSYDKIVEAEDLIIATTDVTRNADIIGKANLIPNIYENDILLSCDIAKITTKHSLDKFYLEKLFNSQHYHDYIKGFASGTLVLHLNMDGVNWYKVIIPAKNILDEFSVIMKNIQKKKDLIIKENETLKAQRDFLLPMLMNGQVSVK